MNTKHLTKTFVDFSGKFLTEFRLFPSFYSSKSIIPKLSLIKFQFKSIYGGI